MQLVTSGNEEKVKEYKDDEGILYKISDGEVDDRNSIQKTKDDIISAIGNIGYDAGNSLINVWQAIQRGQQNKRNQEYETLKEVSKGSNEVLDKIYNSENPIGNFVSDKLNKQKQINKTNIQRNIEKSSNPLSKKVSELSANIGSMAVGTGLSAIDPALGTTYFISSAMQNYYDDAKERGMTDEEAGKYSTIMGLAEGASEMIGVGNLAKGTKAISKSALKQGLKDLGISAIDNAIQEAVIEPTSELVAGKYGNWDNMRQRMLQAGIDGALIGGIMAGAGAGVGSAVNVYDKVKNNQKVSTLEINKAINDTKQAGIDINNTQNQTNPVVPVNNIQQENNVVAPIQNYIYEKSNNTKINNLRQDASRYFNNSEKTRNYINMLEKIVQDKNIDIRFNNNIVDNNGNIANGKYENGTIIINPNSTRVGEFIAVHELTHAIGTDSMRSIIENYRKSNVEFDNTVKELLENYNSTELTEEAMANVSAELFGNQEFINNLAQKNPNIFKRIYNEIKYLWHQFTGYKNEDQFISDLQYKWEQAYRTNKLNDTTNYSIAGRKSLENIRNDIVSYNKGINSYNQALNLANQKINNEQIRQLTGWFQDKNGDWKYEFSDKNITLKNIKLEKNKTYKLKELLKHDDLFILYPELKDYNVLFEDMKKSGYFHKGKNENLIGINKNKINSKKSIEGTLIHEIQHAIQNIEGFEHGTGTKGSKLAYYNNLGEIEADDTKLRYIAEKQGKLNRSLIPPESSKTNPQHSKLNNYLNDRGIIDKMKDGLYNYLKDKINKGEYDYEYDYESNQEDSTQDTSMVDRGRYLKTENSNESSFSMEENKPIPHINSIQEEQNKVVLPINQEGKERKHYKSIMQSQHVTNEARSIAKSLLGLDTYVPDSNTRQLETADKRISISGADNELQSLLGRATTGGNIKADDIAVGERLIQYYSKLGDRAKLQEAIQATAMAGTAAGQTVQAMSLLNHQTPEGQAIWLQRSVDKMNNDLKRKRGVDAEQFNLTDEMLEKIVNSNNNEELQNNLDEVYKELGQQVSKSAMEKIDSWRYFAMLANPRTHIRNIVGNLAMGQTQRLRNKIAGSIEAIVSKVNPDIERTHTIVPASKEVKQFAKNDIVNVADRLGLNENKYNPKSRLQNNMRTFESDILENTVGKVFNLNDKALEAEDGWGLKAGYKNALSEYMTANNLTPDNITDVQLAKARNYAVEQAKEATFHQESRMASLLNQLSNRNKFAKYTTDAVLPFVKTPLNIAKSGIGYSPVGLVKSAIYDTVQLRKGNISINQYIDNISKGLTGTGIALVGYALADAGILKASGSDDKDKEKYDESTGRQTYSIQIGDNTYSLDWLAPTGIPLFIGAEISELSHQKEKEKTSSSDQDSKYNQALETTTNLLNALTNSMNPMTEMSMLSGLTSALSSYEQGSSQMLASIGTNAAKSYVNQFIPTALGQIAKTTDKYERNTTSTKTDPLSKAVDTTKNQIINKIPGLRKTLPIKTDIWGNNMEQSSNVVQRGLENAVLPWARKNVSSSNVDKELNKLYDKIGESSILPDIINKKLTINGKEYRLTNEEYSNYKKEYGKTSYNLINDLISSKEYKSMSDIQKQKAIEEIYSYAKECNKVDYAKKNKETIDTSTLYNTLTELKKAGGNQSNYLGYTTKIEGLKKDSEKTKVLANADYNKKTKSIIYKNTVGKEDDFYSEVLEPNNLDINEYLKYKSQTFTSEKDTDGNTISGSKKKAVANYINTLNLSSVEKAILFAKAGYTDSSYKQAVYNYINKLNLSATRKAEIWKKLGYK